MRDTSLAKRTAVLFKFRDVLNARGRACRHRHQRARQGPVRLLGEFSRSQDFVQFTCGINYLLQKSLTGKASTGVDVLVLLDGFRITVLPAASAGPSFQVAMFSG